MKEKNQRKRVVQFTSAQQNRRAQLEAAALIEIQYFNKSTNCAQTQYIKQQYVAALNTMSSGSV